MFHGEANAGCADCDALIERAVGVITGEQKAFAAMVVIHHGEGLSLVVGVQPLQDLRLTIAPTARRTTSPGIAFMKVGGHEGKTGIAEGGHHLLASEVNSPAAADDIPDPISPPVYHGQRIPRYWREKRSDLAPGRVVAIECAR